MGKQVLKGKHLAQGHRLTKSKNMDIPDAVLLLFVLPWIKYGI